MNTQTQTAEAVVSSAELGPLPPADGTTEVNVRWTTTDNGFPCQEYEEADAWSERLVREYTAAEVSRAVAAERERCAAWVDARRDAFCEEHGSIDPDTGTLEFGRGAHAEAKSEYVGELEEIAAGLRALPWA